VTDAATGLAGAGGAIAVPHAVQKAVSPTTAPHLRQLFCGGVATGAGGSGSWTGGGGITAGGGGGVIVIAVPQAVQKAASPTTAPHLGQWFWGGVTTGAGGSGSGGGGGKITVGGGWETDKLSPQAIQKFSLPAAAPHRMQKAFFREIP